LSYSGVQKYAKINSNSIDHSNMKNQNYNEQNKISALHYIIMSKKILKC